MGWQFRRRGVAAPGELGSRGPIRHRRGKMARSGIFVVPLAMLRSALLPGAARICGALALLVAATLAGVAVASDVTVLALLKAAPNVAPAEDVSPQPAEAKTEELHPARRALALNPIHDESNPDYPRLQKIDDATRLLARDAIGFPDWMAALRSGAISPRAGLSEKDTMTVLDLDILMKRTREMPQVVFPHRAHTQWLDCSNCHPAPFVAQAGANPVSMTEIFRGKFCGMCHDRVAFITFFSCDRCHRGPPGTPS